MTKEKYYKHDRDDYIKKYNQRKKKVKKFYALSKDQKIHNFKLFPRGVPMGESENTQKYYDDNELQYLQ